MSLFLVTAPAYEPLSLTEAKLHCRIDASTEDPLIDALIRSAREYVEAFTRRRLVSQTWDLKLDTWTCDPTYYDAESNGIRLPHAPCASVTSVSYVDGNGATQVWAAGSTGYLTDLPTGPTAARGRIYPAYAVSYPTLRGQVNAVTVRFVSGYSGTAKTVSSITRSGTTATVTTSAAHGYSTGQRVTIAGADQAAYNGTFEITVTGAATFTVTVSGSPTTPATGAMTVASFGIPDSITAAMKLLVGHWYLNRESVVTGTIATAVPQTADPLLWPYRVF